MSLPTHEEALAHFGVKGMKWGVRTAEIKGARQRHDARVTRLNNMLTLAENTPSLARRKELVGKVNKLAKEGLTSGDLSKGARLTTGEKIATLLLTGGLGTVVLKADLKATQKHSEVILKNLGNLKVSDID